MIKTVQAASKEKSYVPSKTDKIIEQFIDEFGDDFLLDDVRLSTDDAGKCIEIYVMEEESDEARNEIPYDYNGYRTIVIGIEDKEENNDYGDEGE